MKEKLTSVQRRLLREQDEELELDLPDDPSGESGKEVADKAPEKVDDVDEELDEMPIEGEDEASPKEGGLDIDDLGADIDTDDEALPEEGAEEKTAMLTKTIDELEDMRSGLNKKGLLVAMQLNDFSTQKRLQTLSDELGNIISSLSDKMLKEVSRSPSDLKQATAWLSGNEGEL